MDCWKLNCLREPVIFCPCTEKGIYSCEIHLIEHLKENFLGFHQPKAPNPRTKEALFVYLMKRNLELNRLQSKLINDTSQRIRELNLELKTAVDEIKRVKKENKALIENIIASRKIKKDNEIWKTLTLNPDLAIKSVQSIIGKLDRKKIPDYIKFESDDLGSLNNKPELYLFKNSPKQLLRVDVNNLESQNINILLWKYDNLSMCNISDNRLLCFGSSACSYSPFILYSDSSIRYIPNRLHPCNGIYGIYYKNEVYVFGGYAVGGYVSRGYRSANEYVLIPEKYNCLENKWKSLSKIATGASYCTGIGYKDKIFFIGDEHRNIYVYDILIDSYSEIEVNLPNSTGKVLYLRDGFFYLIESSSNIYEIHADTNRIKIIGSCLRFGHPVFQTVYKNCAYFTDDGGNIFKFDLALKSIQNLKIK